MATAFDFDLDQFVFFGGYPGAATLLRDEGAWRNYIDQAVVSPNIKEDTLALERVAHPVLLRRLFRLGCEYSGQVLSYNKMLGQLQESGNVNRLADYLELLSQTSLITGISKIAGQAVRQRASSPKLNVLNTALMSATFPYTFAEAREYGAHWGRLVESAVGAHLINTSDPWTDVYYWRQNGREVASKSSEPRFIVKACHIVGEGGIPLGDFLRRPATEWYKR